jgi:hypothetical protein
MFCVCAVSIHLDTSVQVTNIGMNPPYVDLYYATTVFFSSCDCAQTFSQTGNGDFEGPSSTSKVFWLQEEDADTLPISLGVCRCVQCILNHVAEVTASV